MTQAVTAAASLRAFTVNFTVNFPQTMARMSEEAMAATAAADAEKADCEAELARLQGLVQDFTLKMTQVGACC